MSDDKLKLEDLELNDTDWDQFIREYEAERQAKKLRHANPYVLDLIKVLRGREKGMTRQMVLHFVRKNRERLGLPIRKTFDETVQQSYERFCVDSDVFKARRAPASEGLFCWPHGKHKGHWAICAENAEIWLTNFVSKRRQR